MGSSLEPIFHPGLVSRPFLAWAATHVLVLPAWEMHAKL
jgi:hypothetical protein